MSGEQLISQSGVTGASVLAVKYQDGIMMCYDTLASHGSSSRLTGVDRVIKVGSNTLVAASGEISDFQYLADSSRDLESEDWLCDDGTDRVCFYSKRGPSEWAEYISRICYQKRGELDPLCNNFVLGGINKKRTEEPHYLATLDPHGTLFEEDVVATGSGEELALPIMRSRHRNDMTEAEARGMLEECMRVLFHRHGNCSNKVKFAAITAEGSNISDEVLFDMWTTPSEEEVMALQIVLWGGNLKHDQDDRASFPVLMALKKMPDGTAKSIGEVISQTCTKYGIDPQCGSRRGPRMSRLQKPKASHAECSIMLQLCLSYAAVRNDSECCG
ncbi:Proteasome subunit beta type-4 [Perkinsus olseni]|uniref:Proteasome subunit beta type-4 n=1 Tax=Perkinsus olseni TaxID=32597 RepID=A0A7J6LQP3_PEROL|nr:Proteasome subunit beta type-4 [Perkinsus olseni]